MKLSPSTAERIEKSAEVFCESLEGESEYLTAVVHYKAGATAEAERAEKLAEALEQISMMKEGFAEDNYRAIELADEALAAYREGKDV